MQVKEQDTGQIINVLNKCIASLPGNKLKDVVMIGVSGQMHGVVFWKAKSGTKTMFCPNCWIALFCVFIHVIVCQHSEYQLPGCDWSSGNYFRAKDTSQLITWQDGRCNSDFLATLPAPNSHLSLATGFGCATIFWYMRHRYAWQT